MQSRKEENGLEGGASGQRTWWGLSEPRIGHWPLPAAAAAVPALTAFVLTVGNEAMDRVGNLEMKRHNGNRYTIRVRTGRLCF